jgi:hypothetical protein
MKSASTGKKVKGLEASGIRTTDSFLFLIALPILFAPVAPGIQGQQTVLGWIGGERLAARTIIPCERRTLDLRQSTGFSNAED